MEKIKNILIIISVFLLIILFFIYYKNLFVYNLAYITENLDTQSTCIKTNDNNGYLDPVNVQIININTRLDSLENLTKVHDTDIKKTNVSLNNLLDEIKKTEDEINKSVE